MNFLFHLFFVLAAFISSVLADLNVLSPKGLKEWWNNDNNAQYTATSIATFGYTPWGRRIVGSLKLAEPFDACGFIKQGSKEFLEHSIMVAMRGNCTFVVKAHYAQLAGAKMLLIVDDTYEDVNYHLMVDNTGQGESVHIPVALVSRQAGDKLIDSLKSQNTEINKVSVSFDFKMNKTEKVKYNLWLTSSSIQSYEFVKKWEEYEQQLAKAATMEIHYAHYSTSDSLSNCVCGGRYCAADPDGDLPGTGGDVILEDLRQICILKQYTKESWMKYMKNYDPFCLSSGSMKDCSNTVLASIGIAVESIDACVTQSFDTTNANTCNKNTYLEPEKDAMTRDGIYLFPSININGMTYRGNLFPVRNVVEAVCLSVTDLPPVCRPFVEVEGGTSTYLVILGIAVFLAVSVMIIAFCYQKGLRRELDGKIRQEVSIMMEQYSALKETGER